MKILATISYYRPYVSGLTVCAQRLIEGLSKRGFEFTVLTSRNDKSLPRIERKGKVLILRETVMFTVGKVPVMPRYLFSLIREMRRADLVWVNLPQAEGLITAIVGKLFGKRILVTLHCLPLLPSGLTRFLCQRVFDLVNNLVIFLADKVVYYTKDYAENTKELWHFPEKSRYVFPPIPGVRSREYGVRKSENNDEIVVGFAGRMAEEKGLEYLIKALQLMKAYGRSVRLIMAGSRSAVGEGRYSKKIFSLIDESGVNVEFLGVIDPEKMGEFYSRIDVLVLPSVNRTEAFGMVQPEAMISGVSVVATNLPGVRVPIKLTAAGKLTPPKNSAALLRAIGDALAGRQNGRVIVHRAERQFSLTETLSSYERILRQAKN